MCGRYTQTKAESLLRKRFRIQPGIVDVGGGVNREGEMTPRYNLAPGQEARVVLVASGERRLVPMRWGLVPSWAKDEAIGSRLINARAETLVQKASFRPAFVRRRCLVPADGFFEWRKEPGSQRRIPIRYVLDGEDPFAFAGLWEAWKAPDGHELRTFTLITTTPNELVAPVHDRMPAILREEDEEVWLDPSVEDPERLGRLLGPFPAEKMEAYEVSSRINSSQFDEPACIERRDSADTAADEGAAQRTRDGKPSKKKATAQLSLFD